MSKSKTEATKVMSFSDLEAKHPKQDKVLDESINLTQRSIWDLTEDLHDMLDEIEENGGEIEEHLMSRLTDVEQAIDQKIDNYVGYMRYLQRQAEYRREEAARLAKHARIEEARIEKLKAVLLEWMTNEGMKKHDTGRFKILKKKAGGKRALEVAIPASDLPEGMKKAVWQPVNDAIRKELENGKEVIGCSLKPQGVVLQIT